MAKKKANFEDITLSGVNNWKKAEELQHIIVNEYIGMVLHNVEKQSAMLREGYIYRLAEGRIVMVTEGSIEMTLDLEEQTWKKGDIVLMAPDGIEEIKRRSDDFDMIAVAFNSDIHLDENLLLHTNAKQWREMLEMMYMLWTLASHEPFRQRTVLSHVSTIVYNIQDIARAEQQSNPPAKPSTAEMLFRRFKKLVSEHCERERNVPFYAEQLFISPHHLSAVISKQSGRSVMYWINRATILRAKVLLKAGDLKTNEIADRLNFPHHSTFTKFFKRETGMSPKDFQELD